VKAVLMQAGAHVIGCVVNKQRRGRHDTTSSYYYQADERKRRGGQNAKARGAAVVPDALKPSKGQEDAYDDRTIKILPAPVTEEDAQYQPDLATINTIKMPSTTLKPKTPSRPEMAGGRQEE
jgi:hypothetical protein